MAPVGVGLLFLVAYVSAGVKSVCSHSVWLFFHHYRNSVRRQVSVGGIRGIQVN